MHYILYRKSDLRPMGYPSYPIPKGYTMEDEINVNIIPNFGGSLDDYAYIEISEEENNKRIGNAFNFIVDKDAIPVGIETMTLSADKPSILADGADTATITAQVDDENSTEQINFYINGELVAEENAVNGVASIQVNATQTGEIVIEAESTTKYGRNSITIEVVEA